MATLVIALASSELGDSAFSLRYTVVVYVPIMGPYRYGSWTGGPTMVRILFYEEPLPLLRARGTGRIPILIG